MVEKCQQRAPAQERNRITLVLIEPQNYYFACVSFDCTQCSRAASTVFTPYEYKAIKEKNAIERRLSALIVLRKVCYIFFPSPGFSCGQNVWPFRGINDKYRQMCE